MHHFSLVDLQAFCAVADEGNLARGAQRVHLSPSTVCSRIKGLEAALGVSLFTRTSRGMTVTPAGDIVRGSARSIDREIEAMLAKLEPFASREAGTLRVVSNYGAAVNFLSAGLARFLKLHPDITVSHHRCNSREVVEAVAEDKADIGLGAYVGSFPGVTFIDYAKDDLVVVASTSHPLARLESVDFAQCLDEDFVGLNESVEMQSFVEARARDLGRRIVPRVRVANQAILFQMAAAGVGIGVASRVAFEAQPAAGACAVMLTNDWARRNIRIAVPADESRRDRWTQEFITVLKTKEEARPENA